MKTGRTKPSRIGLLKTPSAQDAAHDHFHAHQRIGHHASGVDVFRLGTVERNYPQYVADVEIHLGHSLKPLFQDLALLVSQYPPFTDNAVP